VPGAGVNKPVLPLKCQYMPGKQAPDMLPRGHNESNSRATERAP
jgi:hypothetical protein